jgi:hypothetical protein
MCGWTPPVIQYLRRCTFLHGLIAVAALLACGSAMAAVKQDDGPSRGGPRESVERASTGDAAVAFSGTVVDADAQPVAGVGLVLVPSSGEGARASTSSGSDGTFSLVVTPGAYDLSVGYPYDPIGPFRFRGTGNFTTTVDLSTSVTDRLITIPRLTRISVEVRDAQGNVVPDAYVGFTPSRMWTIAATTCSQVFGDLGTTASGNEGCEFSGSTGADGRVGRPIFPGSTEGVRIDVSSPPGSGLANAATQWSGTAVEGEETVVTVEVFTLGGALLDPAGEPLPEQLVELTTGDETVAADTTDAAGQFALTVPPGTYDVTLSGQFGDPTTYEVTAPGIDLSNGREVDLRLPYMTLPVLVTGPSGAPVPGAALTMLSTPASFPFLDSTASGTQSAEEQTDALGRGELSLLPTPGTVTITVTPPAASGLVPARHTFTPLAGAPLTVALSGPPKLTATAPTASSSWPSGSAQSVTWSVAPAVSAGEFRISLINQTTNVWYVNRQVLAVEERTDYRTSLTAAVPAGRYRAAVYWRPTVGSGTWLATTKSAAFTVTPINITAPTTTTVWPTQATQYVSWNVNPDMPGGQFLVALVNQTSGTWYVNKSVPALAGKLSYTTAVNTVVPPGSYKAAVYWRPTLGSGAWTATQKSAAFTVAALTIAEPTAATVWPRLTTQSVAWSVSPGLPSGEFRVSLVSAAGTWYVNKLVAVVPGQLPYATTLSVTVPAGSYRAAVYWRPSASSAWVLTQKSAAFTVTG